MNTQQYLGQLKRYDSRIEYKLREIEKLNNLATNIASVQGDGMNIQRTRNMDKMGTAVAKIVDLENQINLIVDRFVEKRDTILSQIDSLESNDFYNILMMRYMYDKSFDEISIEMDRSPSRVKKIHADAIKEFERVYGNMYLR